MNKEVVTCKRFRATKFGIQAFIRVMRARKGLLWPNLFSANNNANQSSKGTESQIIFSVKRAK